MRRHASPHDPTAERIDGREEGVAWIGAGAARGQDQVGGVRATREPRDGSLDGVGVVVDVHDVEDLRAEALDLGPHARLELASRSPGPTP